MTKAKSNQPSLREVIDDLSLSDKYNHLKIILSKNYNRSLGQRYLVVSSSGFGVYELMQVDYKK
jgi:hypothetical protein